MNSVLLTNKKRTHFTASASFCRGLPYISLYGLNKQNGVEQKNTAIPLEIAVCRSWYLRFMPGEALCGLIPLYFIISPLRGYADRHFQFSPIHFVDKGIILYEKEISPRKNRDYDEEYRKFRQYAKAICHTNAEYREPLNNRSKYLNGKRKQQPGETDCCLNFLIILKPIANIPNTFYLIRRLLVGIK